MLVIEDNTVLQTTVHCIQNKKDNVKQPTSVKKKFWFDILRIFSLNDYKRKCIGSILSCCLENISSKTWLIEGKINTIVISLEVI